MRSIQVVLLGVFTILGSFSGLLYGQSIMGLNAYSRAHYYLATHTVVQLTLTDDTVGLTWIYLSLLGLLLGGFLVLAGTFRIPRVFSVAGWIFGLGFYGWLTVFSFWVGLNGPIYTSGAPFEVLAAFSGFIFFMYLLVHRSRVFFRVQEAHEGEAGWKGD